MVKVVFYASGSRMFLVRKDSRALRTYSLMISDGKEELRTNSRVLSSSLASAVAIDGKTIAEIGQGLLVLVGVETGDTEEDMKWPSQ